MNTPKHPTILISGAAQGIGYHLCNHYLHSNFQVVAIDLHSEALENLKKRHENSAELLTLHADISIEDQVVDLIHQAVERFGSLDILVNNSAIASNQPIEQLSFENWRRVIDVNLNGTFLLSKYATPHLRKSKGSIINFASTRALMSEPDTEAYSATKGAILALTHALAISLGPEVRVNSVSPGWIDVSHLQHPVSVTPEARNWTDADHKQHPCGRVGKPEDIAAVVDYLISEGAGFVTGQNFIVDGGMTRKMIYV